MDETPSKPKKKTRTKCGIFCDICQKKMRSRYHLKLHLAVHTGEKNFICHICQKGFQQKWNLVTHTARVHSKEKPFKCSDCGKAFGYSSHFKRHVKTHFLEKIEAPEAVKKRILNPHKCEFCEKSFESNYRLELHMRKHTGVKPFVCDKCGKSFTTRKLIALHMKKKHNMESEYVCEHCGECFPDSQSILLHLKTGHKICDLVEDATALKNDKPNPNISSKNNTKELIPCEVCGKTITRASMKKHLNIHYRNRVYSCKYCSKEFLESGQRNVHERKHTGEKPYLCDVCGRGHSQYGNLLTHRKRYHNLTEKTPRLWKRTSNIPSKDVVISEEPDAMDNTETQEISEASEKPQYTGDETIEEFLKIASKYINKKFEESKSSKEIIESEDDIPLAKFCQNKTENENFNDDNDNEEEEHIEEDNQSENEEDFKLQEEKPQNVRDLKKKINEIIYQRIIKDLEALIDQNELANIVKKTKQKSKDPLKLLLKSIKTIPDNSVIKNKNDKLIWHCWQCESKFKTRHLLSRHLIIHEPEENRPYKCDLCHKTFTQSNNFKEHVMSHKNENQYYCEKCGSGFRHKSHFNMHLRRHEPDSHESKPKKFDCTYCGKKFQTNFHKTEHERIHTKEKPYLCKVCGNQFGALSTLNRHQRTHMNARHQCDICLKFFRQKSSLKRHYNIHSDDPDLRVSCECGKTFSQKPSLKKHKMICKIRTEPVIKSFSCLVCSKCFLTNSDLKRHVATHDSTKRFKCPICFTRLKAKETYRRHLKRHQENPAGVEENFFCEDCDSAFCSIKALRRHIVKTHLK